MDMNIQKYMVLVKAVEYGSFTKAAEVLNYSQSGVSRMVSDLEKEWGVSLLERGRAGVHLTSDGLNLFPFVQNVYNEYQKVQIQIAQLKGLESGQVRIGTFSCIATHWLPNIFKEFQKDYPYIDCELLLGNPTEIENWVLEGRIDCGILRLHTHSKFETIFLEKDRLLVILPKNHPMADCECFPIKALCDYPFILLSEKTVIAEFMDEHNIKPEVRFTVWDNYTIMAMVESGLGISILPELSLQRIPYDIVIKELEIPAYRKIGVLMKDIKTTSIAVKRFLDYLQYRHSR